MAFCTKCGEPLADGVKFCSNCGTATSNVAKDNVESRKQEWAGNVVKCPVCGEVIQSFTAVCPACGFEVNSQKGASSVKQFIEEINEYDVFIAKDPVLPKEGWSAWEKEYRIGWIILNILTVGIPLVIYLVFPLVKPFLFPDKIPALSVNEKRKAALIENITFPNEREATVEAMMFIKSKMAFMVAERFNRKTLYWADIWSTKAEQLNHRASIILKDDKVIKTAYADIRDNSAKLKKKLNVRAGIGFIVIGVYLIMVSVGAFALFGPEKKVETPKQPDINNTSIIQDAEQNASEEDKASPTSENVSPTNDSDFSDATNPSLSDDAGNSLYDGNSSLDDSVEITVQSNECLDVKEFGWFISGEYLECVITITNKSDDYAIECPAFRITAYNENNNVLGTEEQVLSVIYPKQDFSAYCLLFELAEKPTKIVITLLKPEDYFITAPSMLEYPTYQQMIGTNLSVNAESVTGEIYNPNDYDVDSACVTIIFRNDDGEIIMGALEFVDQIPAGGSIPFEAWIYSENGLPSTCEVLAYLW